MKLTKSYTLAVGLICGSWLAGPAYGLTQAHFYTFAGTALQLGVLDGTGTTARFSAVAAVTTDSEGNIYVGDGTSLRKITPAGMVTTPYTFSYPISGLAIDHESTLFVALGTQHLIMKVPAGGVPTNLAGNPGVSGDQEGTGTNALFDFPAGLAMGPAGVLYVADLYNHKIRRVTTDNGAMVTLAGTGVAGPLDGLPWIAQFNHPQGVAVDSNAVVYVADKFNHTIRKITGGSVTTLAGAFGTSGLNDGFGTAARFAYPQGITVDVSNNLYVADTGNNAIRRILPTGWVQTLSGSTVGSSDGTANAALFNQPAALAVDLKNNLYICDYANFTIRKGNLLEPQLFFQTASGQLASWVLDTNAVFQFARLMPNTGGWQLKAAGDIDGDRVSDLLFQNSANDTGGWFMRGDSTYRDARFWWPTGDWVIKACADFLGTGRAQVFFQRPDGTVALWQLDATGVFQSATIASSATAWLLKGATDLDANGYADLIWQAPGTGAILVWFREVLGNITAVTLASTGEWALCGTVDLDENGGGDFIFQTPDSRTGGWFMNADQTGTYRDARFWWPTGGWQLKAAGR